MSGLPGSGSRASLLCPWQFVGTLPTSRWLVAQESSRALVVPAAVPGQARGQTPQGSAGLCDSHSTCSADPRGLTGAGRRRVCGQKQWTGVPPGWRSEPVC